MRQNCIVPFEAEKFQKRQFDYHPTPGFVFMSETTNQPQLSEALLNRIPVILNHCTLLSSLFILPFQF
jgi:hypothetical protein